MVYITVFVLTIVTVVCTLLWQYQGVIGLNSYRDDIPPQLTLEELNELLESNHWGRLLAYEAQQQVLQKILTLDERLVICHARWRLDALTGEFSDQSIQSYRRMHDSLMTSNREMALNQVREYLVRAWMVREEYGMVTALLGQTPNLNQFQFYQMAIKARYQAADVKKFYASLDYEKRQELSTREILLAISLGAFSSREIKTAYAESMHLDLYLSYDYLSRDKVAEASDLIEGYVAHLLERAPSEKLQEEVRMSCLQLERMGRVNDQIRLLWHYRMQLESGLRDRLLRLLVGVENFTLVRKWLATLNSKVPLSLNEQLILWRSGFEMVLLDENVYGRHATIWNHMFRHYPGQKDKDAARVALVNLSQKEAQFLRGLSDLIALNPRNPHLHDLYADLMITRKEPYAAIQSARISYAAMPYSHRLGVRLLTLCIEQGQFDQATRLIDRLKRIFPESQTVVRMEKLNQYAAYLWTGKTLPEEFTIDLEGLEQAADVPSEAIIQIKTLMKGTASDQAQARLMLTKMVKRWPDHQEARLLLADLLFGFQSESLALKHLESFVERQPYRVMSAWRVLLVAWHRNQIRDVKQLKRYWQLITPDEAGTKRGLRLLENWLERYPRAKHQEPKS